jgi:hypothetical protein
LILNVYFPHTTTSINQADVVGGLLNNLVGALAVLLPPPGGGAGPGQLDGGLGRFRLVAAAPAGGAILQFLVPATNAWINFANQAAGDAWVMAPVILPLHMSQFYNKINSYLGNAATATPNKVALFDAVYGAVNVNYIPV